MLKRKILAFLAAVALACGAVGCKADTDTGQADTEQPVQETQQTAATTTIEQNEQTVENVESLETETSAESKDNVTETVIIAGQEFSVDETDVVIYITDDFPLTTDISEIRKLKNLKSLLISLITDGGSYAVDGFEELKGCETLEEIHLAIGLADNEDVHVLETLPNLKSLSLYGSYDDLEFDMPSLEYLYLLGTYDLSRLEKLNSLKDLSLEYNNSEDLSPIKSLPALNGLMITECGFTDYSSILELEDLDALWISSYPMTRDVYNKICEKFPECKVTIINDFIN